MNTNRFCPRDTPNIVALLLTSLCSAVLAGCCCGSSKVDTARQALDAGQPDLALEVITPMLTRKPGHSEGLVVLGDAYILQAGQALALGDDQVCREKLEKAGNAYAGAAASESKNCLAQVRNVSHVLRTKPFEASQDEVAAAWEQCANAELADAIMQGGYSSADLLPEMFASLNSDMSDATQLALFQQDLGSGHYFIVPPGEPVATAGVDGSEGRTLRRFEVLQVKSIAGDSVEFEDTNQPKRHQHKHWIPRDYAGSCGTRRFGQYQCTKPRCPASHSLQGRDPIR